ncbi:sterol desaturase family protein [Kozakia baliensis]|nr:sterol desaturase family protein [Kozakia baliensis]GEL63455.1 fatty acid hydroxylase [Kozakia baliensis]
MSVRLFNSSVLERLTFMPMHWFLPVWVIVLTAAGWSCHGISAARFLSLLCLGIVLWTLIEYAAHRFLFHLKLNSERGKQFIFLIHGNHHADPADHLRNMMPLIVTLPLAAIIWSGLWLAFGPAGTAAFTGFGIGYVMYDLTHYATHQYSGSSTLFQRLKQHHLRHHYVAPEANYAITAIFWDTVFRTCAPRRRR